MAGAHLDSVQDGAGINDNGSGSAALLEVAIQLTKQKPTNTVRFAWWGAEESGLLGSEHYVANLTPEEREAIALYLNFDMIGSPNFMFGVYDGDNSSGTAPPGFIPPGSAEIEDVFESFFADRGLAFNDTEFSGRSDYGPFIAVGIPAGGLFTGAEGVKTAAQAEAYGGVAGAAYDPCYHQFCDNLRGDGQDEALYDALREDYELSGTSTRSRSTPTPTPWPQLCSRSRSTRRPCPLLRRWRRPSLASRRTATSPGQLPDPDRQPMVGRRRPVGRPRPTVFAPGPSPKHGHGRSRIGWPVGGDPHNYLAAARISAKRAPGPLAQLAEQRTFNPRVVGSSPTGPTTVSVQWPSMGHAGRQKSTPLVRAFLGVWVR